MENKKNLTRSRILEATYECIAEYGYSKTNFADVGRRAGISRSLMYLYFKNKEDLFITMTNERHDNYIVQSGEVLRSDFSKKEKLQKIIGIWIIDPYRIIVKTPQPDAWLDELKSVAQSELKFRELFIKSLAPLLGKGLAEVVVLSFKGLLDDRPPVKTLQKRADILIDMSI